MGWIEIIDISTGEKVLEVGKRPSWAKDDDYVCPNSGIALNEPETPMKGKNNGN